jgi:pimeloyl-ACP methyl ester carboxylesterase
LAELTARGVRAVAVDLPGHGADDGPLTGLSGDAERVRDALDQFDEPGVLVGHSYGGVVITQAGLHPRVSDLVYLASFNLDENESAMSVAVAESTRAAIDYSDRPDALAHTHVDEDGTSTIDVEGARTLFYNDCPDALAQWAASRLGPHPIASLSEVPDAVAWRHRPSTYAVCTRDNIVHPELQRILARRADHVVEWPTGHSPFLSRPDLVADLLVEVAGGGDDGTSVHGRG